jgi:hypothetical protein
MNVSQKEATEPTTPPIKNPITVYIYMENKLNSQFHEGAKFGRQLKDSI